MMPSCLHVHWTKPSSLSTSWKASAYPDYRKAEQRIRFWFTQSELVWVYDLRAQNEKEKTSHGPIFWDTEGFSLMPGCVQSRPTIT